MSDPIVIIVARRTPDGGMSGQFVSLTSPQLASVAIAAAVKVVKAFYHRMLHNTRELVSTALII